MIFRAYSIVKNRLNIDIPYFSHHNADSYVKSSFLSCMNEFQEEYETTLNNRFRDFSDFQRIAISYYSCWNNTAFIKKSLNWFEKYIKKQTPDSEYFDIRGNCDFNIVIRTIVKKDNKAFVGIGGGITYESNEEAEWFETIDKAKALMRVL